MLIVTLLFCHVHSEMTSWLGFERKLTTLIVKMVKRGGRIFGAGSLKKKKNSFVFFVLVKYS